MHFLLPKLYSHLLKRGANFDKAKMNLSAENRIYLDHAAASPLLPEVIERIQQITAHGANPSSVHYEGRRARALIDEAREISAEIFQTTSSEVIFTSGASEGIFLSMQGLWSAERPDFWISPLSHSAVWEAKAYLEKTHPKAKGHLLPIDKQGFYQFTPDLAGASFVLIEGGNSEFGHRQAWESLATAVQQLSPDQRPIVIVDQCSLLPSENITQLPESVIMLFSAEKIGGLSGTGMMMVPRQFWSRWNSPLAGKTQEWGFRRGTENLIGITAWGIALKTITQKRSQWTKQYQELNTWWEAEFSAEKITLSSSHNRLHHIRHFTAEKSRARYWIDQLDQAGVAISAGTACQSGSLDPSLAWQQWKKDSDSLGFRWSWGPSTTLEQIQKASEIFRTLKKSA